MMKALYLIALTASLGLSAVAHADCAYPKAPEKIPDGSSASEAEMLDAMKAFKAYDTDVNAYIACLDADTKAKSADGSPAGAIIQMKSMQAKKQKAAVDELTDKAAKFNAQVRAFKSKKG
jgi:hypothetical protein